ncbi:MAG: FAD binding domain-containing protein, partial [Chloroflexaceae bacterium]|nr:FAD binding domain-containing protein [Chloroflexaceae bacterium]
DVYKRQVGEVVRIGATATWSEIERHDGLRRAVPVLPEAVELVGDIQVRNRGTLGGSLAHADPAADAPAVVLALDARIEARGPAGGRSLPADAFFTDMLTTALAPAEILTAIVIPPLGAGEGAAYVKYRHPASGYAIVGVAAYVKFTGDQVSACRVAVTGAGPVATRRGTVEQTLIGSDGSAEAVAAAAARAGEGMEILGDLHASEEYRRAMVAVYTRRALTAAVERARG